MTDHMGDIAARFQRDGFALVEDFLSAAEVADVQSGDPLGVVTDAPGIRIAATGAAHRSYRYGTNQGPVDRR